MLLAPPDTLQAVVIVSWLSHGLKSEKGDSIEPPLVLSLLRGFVPAARSYLLNSDCFFLALCDQIGCYRYRLLVRVFGQYSLDNGQT